MAQPLRRGRGAGAERPRRRGGPAGALGVGDSNNIAATYTTQLGGTAALLLPQILAPFHLGGFLREYQPRTRFALSTTYTSSTYYTRSNTRLPLDYLWSTSAYQQYIFTPVELGIVRTRRISALYQDRLDYLRNELGSAALPLVSAHLRA
ncbi:MAG: hypothetical protein WKG07_34170 [Hymenobacter sp.]